MANHSMTVADGVRGLAILGGKVVVREGETFVAAPALYATLGAAMFEGKVIDNGPTDDLPTYEAPDTSTSGLTFLDPFLNSDGAWTYLSNYTATDQADTPVDWGHDQEDNNWGNPTWNPALISVNEAGNIVVERAGLYIIKPDFEAYSTTTDPASCSLRVGTGSDRVNPGGFDQIFDLVIDLTGVGVGSSKDSWDQYANTIPYGLRGFIQMGKIVSLPQGYELLTYVVRSSGVPAGRVKVGLGIQPYILG